MTVLRIALTGTMRSGKDTVADILQEHTDFKVYRFANGITEIINEYFPSAMKQGKPRDHYQLIGQSLRQLDPDVWVRHLHAQRQHSLTPANELITDLRQENELNYCREQGFTFIKVTADDAVRRRRITASGDVWDEQQLHHQTEDAVKNITADYYIDNSGSMDGLVDQVTAIYKKILQEESEK